MDDPVSVAAVCGSRRATSYTRDALRVALDAAAEGGADTALLDLGDPALDLPLYHPDEDPTSDMERLADDLAAADGALLGTPVYHGSYSSALKSFHDWCGSSEFEDTVVGLVAVAGGGSYATTLSHLRDTVRSVHGLVVPEQVGIRNAADRFEDGHLADDGLRERTREVGRVVARTARRERTAATR
ncbi:MAG: NADPH-dependent FMN reductase [Halobacteriaceae archaeon]